MSEDKELRHYYLHQEEKELKVEFDKCCNFNPLFSYFSNPSVKEIATKLYKRDKDNERCCKIYADALEKLELKKTSSE